MRSIKLKRLEKEIHESILLFRKLLKERNDILISGGTSPDIDFILNNITAIMDEYAEKPAWIRKESKLPLPNVGVLVTDGYDIGHGFYTAYQGIWSYRFFGESWMDDKKATHWMPLPEFPGDVPKREEKAPNPDKLDALMQKCIDEGGLEFHENKNKPPFTYIGDHIKNKILSELPKHFDFTLKEQELLPCPFCGGKGEMVCDGFWFIQCTDCFCEGASSETKEEAIEAWNKRK